MILVLGGEEPREVGWGFIGAAGMLIMSLIPQNGSSRPSLSAEGDSILENLIEECTDRIQAGPADRHR